MIRLGRTGLALIQLEELIKSMEEVIPIADDEKYGISEQTIKLITEDCRDASEYYDIEPKPSKNKFKFKSPNWNF